MVFDKKTRTRSWCCVFLSVLLLAALLAACSASGFDTQTDGNIVSEIISCSTKGNTMTVVFSAQASKSTQAQVTLEVWLSDDNCVGAEEKTLKIHKNKKYRISMQSDWFEAPYETSYRPTFFDVILTIGEITHRFHLDEGEISFV